MSMPLALAGFGSSLLSMFDDGPDYDKLGQDMRHNEELRIQFLKDQNEKNAATKDNIIGPYSKEYAIKDSEGNRIGRQYEIDPFVKGGIDQSISNFNRDQGYLGTESSQRFNRQQQLGSSAMPYAQQYQDLLGSGGGVPSQSSLLSAFRDSNALSNAQTNRQLGSTVNRVMGRLGGTMDSFNTGQLLQPYREVELARNQTNNANALIQSHQLHDNLQNSATQRNMGLADYFRNVALNGTAGGVAQSGALGYTPQDSNLVSPLINPNYNIDAQAKLAEMQKPSDMDKWSNMLYGLGMVGDAVDQDIKFGMRQMGNMGSQGGGGAGAMSGLMSFSDPRLKKDVIKIGKLASGLGVYSFKYLWDKIASIGLMADEVYNKYPDAVGIINGFLTVNYGKVMELEHGT